MDVIGAVRGRQSNRPSFGAGECILISAIVWAIRLMTCFFPLTGWLVGNFPRLSRVSPPGTQVERDGRMPLQPDEPAVRPRAQG